MRPLRGPHPGQMFEITTRAINRRKLLRPSKEVNNIIVGVIGRAQKHVDVQLHAFVFMSTHYHILLTVKSAEDMSKFIGFINCNVTRKLNALNRRTGAGWARRFRAIGVSNDPCTQRRRLRYLLAHGVKEKLVRRAKDWPGASALPWLVLGKPIRGIWTSFTARYHATHRKGYVPRRGEFDIVYVLKMAVLPCWQAMAPERWRRLVAELVAAIEAEAAEEREAEGSEVLGADAVLAADPMSQVPWQRRTRAPSVHAVDPAVYRLFQEIIRLRRLAYAEASARFRAGEWDVEFPAGMFRPLGGFVPHPRRALPSI